MTEIAIRVQNLSKCYQIYDVPGDRLKQFVAPRLQRLAGQSPKQYFREFWALKDVSFEIKKGETVGIIGRNGSGKSTLLQMVCGTLNPTSGRIQTDGRIAALLELGSGFNLEFTGRENVYMNAAVWGLSNEEIEASFNDIVAFADIGDFVDQPVKTYSSGMFVRLAFAVAVHVHPDILVVDEALSVGDIAFQNKCMEKIKAIKETGTSILFVSHDLSTVQIICDRVIWMKGGSQKMVGYPVDVCQEYYVDSIDHKGHANPIEDAVIVQQTTGLAQFSSIKLSNSDGTQSKIFDVGGDIRFEFMLEAEAALEESVIAVSVYRTDGDWLLGQSSREKNVFWPPIAAGEKLTGQLHLSPNCLAPGDYKVAFAAYSTDHKICYALTDLVLPFSVRTNYQTWGKFIHPCVWIN
ncbi:ABC transporter ATP-binding protein [Methyloglobulus sp.]|uniref:ABC transporter ATP-binding protein n=1 Tax=Methyloglobulus sp. TaxID=2518622 RepID=UPI00398906E6